MSLNVRTLKIGLVSAVSVGVFFATFCAIFHVRDLMHVALAGGIGAFTGLVGAPVFEPKAFKMPHLFQLVSGACGGLMLGLFIKHSDPSIVFLCTAIGAIVGYYADKWVEHIQIP